MWLPISTNSAPQLSRARPLHRRKQATSTRTSPRRYPSTSTKTATVARARRLGYSVCLLEGMRRGR